jgi:hypothetical protein
VTARALSPTPAWPINPSPQPAPMRFDALHCLADNRVRVASTGGKHFVSIDGDNFIGPLRSFEDARAYGERCIGERS